MSLDLGERRPEPASLAPTWPDPDPSGGESDLPVAFGERLADRYVIESLLGTGGMGVVARARHVELEQTVAIKFLRKRFLGDRTVTARFLEEAKAAAALRSDHAVRVMDVGQTDAGVPYYVMEYLEGVDLETLLVQEGPLRIGKAIDFVRQACAALSEAHALGIVHRDVKPENLFLARHGEKSTLKVVDFGIAKRLDPARAKVLTGPQESMGSPCYMSPEQMWTPRTVDTRTDIWSLGVVLYQLLTGNVPFDAESVSDIFAKVAGAEYAPVSTLRPDVDPFLEAIVKRCLEKSLEARYPSVLALSRDLDQYEETVLRAKADPSAPRFASPAPPVTRSEAPVTSPSKVPLRPSEKPSTLVGWLVVAACVLMLVTVVSARKAPETTMGRVASALLDRALLATGSLAPEGGDASDPLPFQTESRPFVVEPAGIVATDEPGATDLRAEPEREATSDTSEPAAPARTLSTAERKERAYRRYLARHGWRPIREVLEEMGETPAH
ncbi:MAG TPA: serine/threonine-protein kinase [Polyangiaceae bacterium]|nr:serine/threonine-protein kinase [Polyangiaceae bacterium]